MVEHARGLLHTLSKSGRNLSKYGSAFVRKYLVSRYDLALHAQSSTSEGDDTTVSRGA